jgi:hypothetical protein
MRRRGAAGSDVYPFETFKNFSFQGAKLDLFARRIIIEYSWLGSSAG